MSDGRESARELWRNLLLEAVAASPCVHDTCKLDFTEKGWYARLEHLQGDQKTDRVVSTDALIGTKREDLVARLARWLAQQHLAEPAALKAMNPLLLPGRADADLVGHIDRSGAIRLLRDGGWGGATGAAA